MKIQRFRVLIFIVLIIILSLGAMAIFLRSSDDVVVNAKQNILEDASYEIFRDTPTKSGDVYDSDVHKELLELFLMKKYESIISLYNKNKGSEDYDNYKIKYLTALTYLTNGDNNKSIKLFEETLVRSNPCWDYSLFNIGKSYIQTKQNKKAYEYFLKLVSRYSFSESFYQALSYMLSASTALNKTTEFRSDLKYLLENEKNELKTSYLLYYLGQANVKLKKDAEAAKNFVDAAENASASLSPKLFDLMKSLNTKLYAKCEKNKLINLCEKILDPDSPDLLKYADLASNMLNQISFNDKNSEIQRKLLLAAAYHYKGNSSQVLNITEELIKSNDSEIKNSARYFYYSNYADEGNPINVLGFAWCYDLFSHPSRLNLITERITGKLPFRADPEYGVHWHGSSIGGPDGNRQWGLDSGDYHFTRNRVNTNTYLEATEEYINYCQLNGYPTKIIFTTGPADFFTGEAGYQGYLKHQYIRNYVTQDSSRILFDYHDILCYDENGKQTMTKWKGNAYPIISKSNLGDGSIGHIGPEGALRLAKAQWWMLARIAGWDGR